MKTNKNKLTRILAAVALPAAAILSGCMSDTGFAVDVLKIKIGHQTAIAIPKEAVAETANTVFKKDCQPYDKSEVTNDFVESPVWKHYKNRNQNYQNKQNE